MSQSILGTYQELPISKAVEFGIYLDGGEEFDEILLPGKEEPDHWELGDTLRVFIYLDSDDRVIATRRHPIATVGQFAFLQTVSVDFTHGAFLDWGLEKDLLAPFREQHKPLEKDKKYLAYIYIDQRSQRIAASTKLDKYLNQNPAHYQTGQEVELIIRNKADLGYNAIINHQHQGMLYHNETFKNIEIGQHHTGYIKKIREDGKIDLSLEPLGYAKIDDHAEFIYQLLRKNGGSLPVSDKSSPETIKDLFGISKKTFKNAIGGLKKIGLITIAPDHIQSTGKTIEELESK